MDPRSDGLSVGFGEWAVVLEASAIRPGKVTFVVKNGGTLTHGFEIERDDGGREFEVEAAEFRSGEIVQVSTSLTAGTYEVYCYIGDHEDRGMVTRLVVRADAPLAATVTPTASTDVAIRGFAFQPTDLRVSVGSQVTWSNQDPADHTVTADEGSFGSDPIGNGRTFSARFDTPGTFAYFCAIHPSMRGTIGVS